MIKQKVMTLSSNNSPYKLFSSGHNFGKELSTIRKSSARTHHFNAKKNKSFKNNIFIPPKLFKAKTKDDIRVFLTAKNLKSMTLSNELYLNYMDYYSNLTQDYCFKTPKIANYPIRKNEKYLSIITQQDLIPDLENENSPKKKSIFFDLTKEADKKDTKKRIEPKPYGFKYGETRIMIEKQRPKTARPNPINGKEFQNLCEINIYESELLKEIGIKNIDMFNSKEEKNKNFNFFIDYLEKIITIDNLMNEDNSFKNIEFKAKTAIIKQNISFKLNIYSLCFKFYLLEKNEKPQKLYFPFKLLPLFYLLDFQSFKVFISEIIYYDNIRNCFSFIGNDLLLKKIKKYYHFASNNIKINQTFQNYITYNKNELSYFLIFDWIIFDKNNLDNNNNNYKCYKLKIILPKIKFIVDNYNIKIIRHLNKHIIANLIFKDFDNWEKFILFDLFSNRKFKNITNLIMINKQNMIKTNKIILNKDPAKYSTNNRKKLSFYLSEAGENYSNFYIFIPYTILVLSGEHQKRYQKINLNWKESKNLLKFENYWGIINTLLKCMFIDNITNEIFFRLELLDTINNDLYKIIIRENSKTSNNSINNKKSNNNYNSLFAKKNSSKNNIFHLKDKEKNKTKYKTSNLEISVLECSLKKVDISEINSESKYYKIPQKLLETIFGIKDDKELFNNNFNNISIIGKCIGECSESILYADEENIINEEQTMMKKAKDSIPNKIIGKFQTEKVNINQNNKIMANTFNKYNSLRIGENKNYSSKKTIKIDVERPRRLSVAGNKRNKNLEEKIEIKQKMKYIEEYNEIKSNPKRKKIKISKKSNLDIFN